MKQLVFSVLFFLTATVLTAWTFDDCVEVDFDHPDCDRYTTTTTGQVTTTTVTEQTTTTVTQPEVTTTVVTEPPTTTTTIPFDSVPPITDTTSVISTTQATGTIPAELPFTGVADIGLLALAVLSLGFLGFVALRWGKE